MTSNMLGVRSSHLLSRKNALKISSASENTVPRPVSAMVGSISS